MDGIGKYGWPKKSQNFKTWDLISQIYSGTSILIFCFSDFNEVLFALKK